MKSGGHLQLPKTRWGQEWATFMRQSGKVSIPKFLRRVDTALNNIGINERVPYNAPLIQFSSWMGSDRDGMILFLKLVFIDGEIWAQGRACTQPCLPNLCIVSLKAILKWNAGNPRVTPEVTRDVCLLARMTAANLYFSQIEDLMFEVSGNCFHSQN